MVEDANRAVLGEMVERHLQNRTLPKAPTQDFDIWAVAHIPSRHRISGTCINPTIPRC